MKISRADLIHPANIAAYAKSILRIQDFSELLLEDGFVRAIDKQNRVWLIPLANVSTISPAIEGAEEQLEAAPKKSNYKRA
jgi:hypothetical protein